MAYPLFLEAVGGTNVLLRWSFDSRVMAAAERQEEEDEEQEQEELDDDDDDDERDEEENIIASEFLPNDLPVDDDWVVSGESEAFRESERLCSFANFF